MWTQPNLHCSTTTTTKQLSTVLLANSYTCRKQHHKVCADSAVVDGCHNVISQRYLYIKQRGAVITRHAEMISYPPEVRDCRSQPDNSFSISPSLFLLLCHWECMGHDKTNELEALRVLTPPDPAIDKGHNHSSSSEELIFNRLFRIPHMWPARNRDVHFKLHLSL